MKKRKIYLVVLASLAITSGNAATFTLNDISYETLADLPSKCEVVFNSDKEYEGSIEIPSTVEYEGVTYTVARIGEYAFSLCDNLTSVSLPASIETIGRNAFESCSSLQSIELPEGVEILEEQTFYGCVSLNSFRGFGIKEMGKSVFSNCTSLYETDFSENLYYIGDSCFKNCSALTVFSLPNEVSLGTNVFSSCSSLKVIEWPKSVTEIPAYTFKDCTSLERVVGTTELIEIGDYSFSNCFMLQRFDFGSELAVIGKHAFDGCDGLTVDSILGKNLIIGEFAFFGCTQLESLKFDNVNSIENEAFAGCSQLSNVTFDANMYNIGAHAFQNCTLLTKINCFRKLPPFLQQNAFDERAYRTAILTVPKDKELLYRQTAPWNLFLNITEDPEAGLGMEKTLREEYSIDSHDNIIIINGPATGIEIYTISGLKVFEGHKDYGEYCIKLDSEGIYIVNLDNYTIKIINR